MLAVTRLLLPILIQVLYSLICIFLIELHFGLWKCWLGFIDIFWILLSPAQAASYGVQIIALGPRRRSWLHLASILSLDLLLFAIISWPPGILSSAPSAFEHSFSRTRSYHCQVPLNPSNPWSYFMLEALVAATSVVHFSITFRQFSSQGTSCPFVILPAAFQDFRLEIDPCFELLLISAVDFPDFDCRDSVANSGAASWAFVIPL